MRFNVRIADESVRIIQRKVNGEIRLKMQTGDAKRAQLMFAIARAVEKFRSTEARSKAKL